MNKTGPILLVEDNEDDVFLVKRALKIATISIPLEVAMDGQEAVEFLAGCRNSGAALPIVVLLDLKIPKKSGFEVLSWVRGAEGLKSLPVIMLTSSNQMSDIDECYRLGANAFVVKPASFDRLVAFVNALRDFWVAFNRF